MTKREIRKALRTEQAMTLSCGSSIAISDSDDFLHVGVADRWNFAGVSQTDHSWTDSDGAAVAAARETPNLYNTLHISIGKRSLPDLAMIIQVLIEEGRKRKGN